MVNVAFHVFAVFIEGRDIVILLQIGYGIQDFVIKTVAKTVLLVVIPISLSEKFGLSSWRNNCRETRIIHDAKLGGDLRRISARPAMSQAASMMASLKRFISRAGRLRPAT